MKTNAKIWPIVTLASLVMSGCAETQTAGNSNGGAITIDNAILAISKNRNRAEDAAAAVKEKFKGGRPQYVKAERLYREARAENNGWLDLLQNKIRNGAKPERSPDFNEQSK